MTTEFKRVLDETNSLLAEIEITWRAAMVNALSIAASEDQDRGERTGLLMQPINKHVMDLAEVLQSLASAKDKATIATVEFHDPEGMKSVQDLWAVIARVSYLLGDISRTNVEIFNELSGASK